MEFIRAFYSQFYILQTVAPWPKHVSPSNQVVAVPLSSHLFLSCNSALGFIIKLYQSVCVTSTRNSGTKYLLLVHS